MKRKIIGLVGHSGAGKDTIYKVISNMYYPYTTRFSFADMLRQDLTRIFKDDGEQELIDAIWDMSPYRLPESRALLTAYADLLKAALGKEVISNRARRRLGMVPDREVIVVTDVRFQPEVDMLRGLGASLVRVHRDKDPWTTLDADKFVDSFDCDAIIDNNGSLAELEDEVEKVVGDLLKELL